LQGFFHKTHFPETGFLDQQVLDDNRTVVLLCIDLARFLVRELKDR